MLTSSDMSPADIAAVTNGGDGLGANGNIWWVFILFLFMMGWGNNGFGYGGGNGVGSEVQRGFDQSAVMNGINNLTTGQCNQTMNIMQGLNGLQSAMTASATGLNNTMMQNEMARQQCCCDTKQAIADLKYTIATEACADRAAVTAGVQSVLDKLCQQELETLRVQNANLQTQLNMANLAASHNAQTAAIQADNAAQTQYIVNRIAPYPVPSYQVANPYSGIGYGGCGCGM